MLLDLDLNAPIFFFHCKVYRNELRDDFHIGAGVLAQLGGREGAAAGECERQEELISKMLPGERIGSKV